MGRLTIDEVIKHCDETVEQSDRVFRILHDGSDFGQIESKNYWEHKQTAEWLRELKRYKDLEESGRLVVLPCKVGDTVYQILQKGSGHWEEDKYILDDRGTPEIYERGFHLILLNDIGKTVFLTREEAEAALKGGEING